MLSHYRKRKIVSLIIPLPKKLFYQKTFLTIYYTNYFQFKSFKIVRNIALQNFLRNNLLLSLDPVSFIDKLLPPSTAASLDSITTPFSSDMISTEPFVDIFPVALLSSSAKLTVLMLNLSNNQQYYC